MPLPSPLQLLLASSATNSYNCFVDFSEQRITSLLNYELADNLGNMVNRVTGVKINPLQTYPCFHLDLFPLSGPTPQGRAMAEDYKLLNTMSTLTGKFSRGEVDSKKYFNNLNLVCIR